MQITLHVSGIFHRGKPIADIELCFKENSVNIHDVYLRAVDILHGHGVLLDDADLVMSLQGKVIPRENWEIIYVTDGQNCSIFPLLAGG